MSHLTLYYMPSCPYCIKVLKFIEQQGVQIPLKDTASNPQNHQELLKLGGKTQVPCLVIAGKPLYESDDIIQWLGDHFKNRNPA